MHRHAHAKGLAIAALVLAALACSTHRATRGPAADAPRVAEAPPPTSAEPAPEPAASPDPPADAFVAAVRPVLLRRCTPCHEPGGVMYARMPFDSPAVVRASREGLLRRLSVPEEKAAVEAWLDGR
jgi:hypothetical protein